MGPGELALRFVSTGPGTARVGLVAYHMTQEFSVQAPGTNVQTEQEVTAGPDACGLATGMLTGTTIRWDACDYGPAPPHGTTAWGPDDVVGGPGCLRDYHVEGVIDCTGSLCGLAGFDGPTSIDLLYPQPLNWFEYAQDLRSFSMAGGGAPALNGGIERVEIPNDEPSRTWFSLEGRETDRRCEPLPDCDD